jgi:hypothetical protein
MEWFIRSSEAGPLIRRARTRSLMIRYALAGVLCVIEQWPRSLGLGPGAGRLFELGV